MSLVHAGKTTNLKEVVPQRRYNRGPSPGITNANKSSCESWTWYRNPESFTEPEMKAILGKVVEIATGQPSILTFTSGMA